MPSGFAKQRRTAKFIYECYNEFLKNDKAMLYDFLLQNFIASNWPIPLEKWKN